MSKPKQPTDGYNISPEGDLLYDNTKLHAKSPCKGVHDIDFGCGSWTDNIFKEPVTRDFSQILSVIIAQTGMYVRILTFQLEGNFMLEVKPNQVHNPSYYDVTDIINDITLGDDIKEKVSGVIDKINKDFSYEEEEESDTTSNTTTARRINHLF